MEADYLFLFILYCSHYITNFQEFKNLYKGSVEVCLKNLKILSDIRLF